MSRRGFTLIELLVVISIIGLLSGIVTASLNSARAKARLSAAMRFSLSTHNALGAETIGAWNFEQDTSTATDISGNGNDGTMTGVTWSTDTYAAVSGHSTAFDGTDYIHVPHNDNHFLSGGLTISAWVKPTGNGGGGAGRIADKTGGTTSANGGFHYFINGNSAKFTIDTGAQIAGGTNSIAYDGTWKHVAVTVNASGLVTHYLNGAVSGAPTTTSAPSAIATTNSLCIGNRAGTGTCNTDRSFGGSLDDIRIYAQALTASEVGRLYAASAPEYRVAEAR